ncbi:hypothetical protein M5689_000587 [Euphorbia peplus]|nr:hypothetical protein M5689_000587 [Euphorbia peplus]
MGKKLEEGQSLVNSVWQHNMSEENYRLSVTSQGMSVYYKAHDVFKQVLTYKASVENIFLNSSLVLAYNASVPNLTMHFRALPKLYLFFGSPTNYSMMSHIKLDHDGLLRIYRDDSESYSISPNLLKDCYNGVCSNDGSHMSDECSYPTSCGGYGFCSNDGSCSCLPRFVDAEKLLGVLGCWLSYPNRCKNASFLTVHDGNYYDAYGENIVKTNMKACLKSFSCKLALTNMNDCAKACLKSCSCKLALFQQFADSATEGDYVSKILQT